MPTKTPAAQVAMAKKAAAAKRKAERQRHYPPRLLGLKKTKGIRPRITVDQGHRDRGDGDGGDLIDGDMVIDKAELCFRLGVTFTTIWNWMRAGEFPRARALGGKSVWLKSEVDEWIKGLPVQPYKGDNITA